MTRIKNYADENPPKRSPREIASQLLTGNLGIGSTIKVSHEVTLTSSSSFADFLKAFRFEEILVLIENTESRVERTPFKNTQKPFLKKLKAYVTELAATGTYTGDTTDLRNFQAALEKYDQSRPLLALVDTVLPKIRDGKPLDSLDPGDLSEAVQMINDIRIKQADRAATLDAGKDTSLGALDRVMHSQTLIRLAKEVHEDLQELDRQINRSGMQLG